MLQRHYHPIQLLKMLLRMEKTRILRALSCERLIKTTALDHIMALAPPMAPFHLSTVLAQDHFLSDFLSLHLTSKTHKVSMMMVMGVDSKTSSPALAADLMSGRSPPGLNGINAWLHELTSPNISESLVCNRALPTLNLPG